MTLTRSAIKCYVLHESQSTNSLVRSFLLYPNPLNANGVYIHLILLLPVSANGVFIYLRYILALAARRSKAKQLLGINSFLFSSLFTYIIIQEKQEGAVLLREQS